MKKLAVFLILTVLSVVAAVAGAEMALRWIGLGEPVAYYTNLTYRFAPVPNQKVVRFDGNTITINDRGLRATRDWEAPADIRILFIGDSVTWGTSSVTDSDTFSEIACARIGPALGLRVTCGNAGVNAYGTDNMAARIRYKEFDNEDWLVVVVLSGDAIRSLQNIAAGHYHMANPTGPLRATWEAANYWFHRFSVALRGTNDREPPQRALSIARASVRNLVAAVREKREQGKRVLLVLTIGKEEIGGDEFTFTPVVRDALAQSGLPFLDMAPVLAPHDPDRIYLDNSHLTPAGNRVFADAIAARIVAVERARRGGEH
jgi:lysophospholipase L1-like esterase